MSESNADLIIYGTLIVVSVIMAIIIWFAIRCTKEQEKQSSELTIDDVLKYYSDKISSDNFLWAVWQGRLSLEKMLLSVKNAKGELVATITYYFIPVDDVLRTIEIGDKKYECVMPNLLSNKTLLRETSSGQILMSCRHYSLRQEYFAGDSEQLKFKLHHRSVFHNSQLIKINNEEVGQLINMYKFKCDALLLNLPVNDITTIEKLYILASIPRRR